MWGINATAAGVGRITRSKTSRSILVRGASWDGPPSKHLLDMMPDVYGDEPREKPADAFTRYVAVTGPGTMFSPDVVVGDEPARLGDDGFFSAPYESVRGLDKANGPSGLFARADGGLAVISETIAPDAFRAVTTIAGRKGIDLSKTPGAFLVPAGGQEDAKAAPPIPRGRRRTPVRGGPRGQTLRAFGLMSRGLTSPAA